MGFLKKLVKAIESIVGLEERKEKPFSRKRKEVSERKVSRPRTFATILTRKSYYPETVIKTTQGVEQAVSFFFFDDDPGLEPFFQETERFNLALRQKVPFRVVGEVKHRLMVRVLKTRLLKDEDLFLITGETFFSTPWDSMKNSIEKFITILRSIQIEEEEGIYEETWFISELRWIARYEGTYHDQVLDVLTRTFDHELLERKMLER